MFTEKYWIQTNQYTWNRLKKQYHIIQMFHLRWKVFFVCFILVFPVSNIFPFTYFNKDIAGRKATLNSWSKNNPSVVTHTELMLYTDRVSDTF